MADEQRPISSWNDVLTRSLELGLGAATLTVEAAQKMVNELVNRGQVSKEEGASLVDKLINAGREQRDQLADMIDKAAARTMVRMDLARRSDVDALRERVAELERVVLGHTHVDQPIAPMSDMELSDNE
ncbi:MAG TPA: hypothetical protein VGL77_18880 [Armatimonadota bacterium]|jgi:polyhydroxyalkanoate synthesis regulator phasin